MLSDQRPHVEEKVTCRCGTRYCVVCVKSCPACQGVHLQPTDPRGYPKGKPSRFRCKVVGPGTIVELPRVPMELTDADAVVRKLTQPMVTTPFFEVDLRAKEQDSSLSVSKTVLLT